MHTLSPTPTHTHTLFVSHTHTHKQTHEERGLSSSLSILFLYTGILLLLPVLQEAFFRDESHPPFRFLCHSSIDTSSVLYFSGKKKKSFFKKRKISAGNFFTPPSLFRALNNIRTNGDLRETCALTQTLLSYAREKKNKKDKESRTLEKNRQKFND